MSHHDRAASYLEGALTPAQERNFIDHLADCEICQAALSDEMQLRDHEERLSEPSRRRRKWRQRMGIAIGSATSLASAAAAVMFIISRDPSSPGTFAWSIEEGTMVMRGADKAQRGDQLTASLVESEFAHAELRVYRGANELVVRCPGDAAPACHHANDGVELTIPLKVVGDYQLIHLYSTKPLPLPTGDREIDMKAVKQSGGRIDSKDIHVD
jgi:hypothetical protein